MTENSPDKELFIQLMQENKGIIYKVCNVYCTDREKHEDLAQEIAYHLWKSFPRYNPELRFSTWMYRVALNVAISFYRKENKYKPDFTFTENLVLFEETSDTAAEQENNMQQVMQFINGLKEIDRSVILLYLDDKPYKEISVITGISESNVSTKVNRIKEKLKNYFKNN